MSTTDRTVHCVLMDNSHLARFDRAGKWYREWPPTAGKPRQRLAFLDATNLARSTGVRFYFGRPGGSRFDAEVQPYVKNVKELN